MAFYEMLPGAGMPSGLQAGMDSVLNKKFGTSTTYPAEGWPDTVNLMGPLPEKTVSGAIVSFPDGADGVPLKKCEITLPASLDGYSEVDVHHTGSNLWDEVTEIGAINVVNGQNVTNNNFIRSTNYIPVLPNTVYYKCAPQNYLQLYYDKDKGYLSYGSWNKNTTFTTPPDCYFVRFYVAQEYGTTYNHDISLNYPSTFTEYAPYSGTTHTASLGRTIYGGQVDIVNGIGTETWKSVKLKDLDWTYSTAYNGFFHSASLADTISGEDYIVISSEYTNMRLNASGIQNNDDVIDVNADNGNPVTGAVAFKSIILKDSDYTTKESLVAHLTSSDSTLVYKVATPTDFTFTGQEVPTRLGYNAFWSEQGDTEVTYRADIALALGE